MKRQALMFLILTCALTVGSKAQSAKGRTSKGSIVGRVVDSELKVPLEYTNIILFDKHTGAQVTGTITGKDGYFLLMGIGPGVYTLELKFMGYRDTVIDPIEVAEGRDEVDLGTLSLARTAILADQVDVVAEKPAIEYEIDKKVINVGKQYTAVSGTAVDVLETVPSVTVDIEGNVSLRGSSNFTVLIDNRPTVLEPSEALEQIPASTIENIEIITNPSAKHDPEGISGIINVITKKSTSRGTNGIVNLNGGLDEKYGANFLVNWRRPGYSVLFGTDYNRQVYPGQYLRESHTSSGDTTSYLESTGDSRYGRTFYGLRGGIDLDLGTRDLLSLGTRYGGRNFRRTQDTDFDEWNDPGGIHSLYTSGSRLKREGDFYSATLDYRHAFGEKNHELTGRAIYSRRGGDEESTHELLQADRTVSSGSRSIGEEPLWRWQLNMDYTLPLDEENRFEAGYQRDVRHTKDSSEMYEYDPDSGDYVFQPDYSHTMIYDRGIHSLYALYSGQVGSFGYQGGLRGEYMDRFVELTDEGETFRIDRWDVFPTAHVSWRFLGEQQCMASYTRRIQRTRGWDLEPFLTWMDAYNVRRGNPDLKPQYIDAYELGYQTDVGANQVSVDAYYRVTHNKVERVQSVYDENVILHTVENVGTDYTLGAELMLNVDVWKWWNVSLLGSLYDYRIERGTSGESLAKESVNWRVRLNQTLKLGRFTRLQVNGVYGSPTVSSQGRREGYFTADVALRQDLLNRNFTVTLQVRDVLRTSRFESTSEGENFYSFSRWSRKSPIVMLNLRYNFNNYKPENDREEEEFQGIEEF